VVRTSPMCSPRSKARNTREACQIFQEGRCDRVSSCPEGKSPVIKRPPVGAKRDKMATVAPASRGSLLVSEEFTRDERIDKITANLRVRITKEHAERTVNRPISFPLRTSTTYLWRGNPALPVTKRWAKRRCPISCA